MKNRKLNFKKVFMFKSLKAYIMTHNNKLTVISSLSIFEEMLNKELKKSIKNSNGGALLFIYSDRFNSISEAVNLSHENEFLETLSKQLESYIDYKSILHKLNENKYLLYIYDIENIDYFKNNLGKKLKDLGYIREFEGDEIYDSANVGISIYPEDGNSSRELINKAKIAMYKSKELGKNKYYFYEDKIYDEMVDKKEMKKDLGNAIKNNELLVYYQPQIDIGTNRIYGVEALLRWNSSRYGYMPPNKFIPLAEETGLIIEIGEWVLKEACIQAKKWQEAGLNIKISINISAIQLQSKYFLHSVKKIFRETNVDPYLITFEITESLLIESTKQAKMVLTELKNMGVKISLDDFGTGYSSLIYLNKFPIDTIKIDKSFIQDLFISPKKIAIIEGIIHIAQNIGMDVTAEGIENQNELELLKEKNCNRGQGYIFSKPLPINEIEIFFIEFTENIIAL